MLLFLIHHFANPKLLTIEFVDTLNLFFKTLRLFKPFSRTEAIYISEILTKAKVLTGLVVTVKGAVSRGIGIIYKPQKYIWISRNSKIMVEFCD